MMQILRNLYSAIRRPRNYALQGTLILGTTALLLVGWVAVLARPAPAPQKQVSPIHPAFALLDQEGQNVLESGGPVSTLKTCGSCHDTEFIASHSGHASAGFESLKTPGGVQGGRDWEIGPGFFGSWNPLLYRYLSPEGEARVDLTTAGWIQTFGAYHVGGGPAQYARDGSLLTELAAEADSVETSILDPESGSLAAWDWQASGVVEMNCFLCHTPDPDNQARIAALEAGRFGWANTATLMRSGIVEQAGQTWSYNASAFSTSGELDPALIKIQDPTNANCAQCHASAHPDPGDPVALAGCSVEDWMAGETGVVISPQRMSASGLNLADKQSLSRAWDVHAERLVQCSDCHYSLNNPAYAQKSSAGQPQHLSFDPRRLEIGEYLERPLHTFANSAVAEGLADPTSGCVSCHNIQATHNWLPYKERHLEAMNCETCHIPQVYTPAIQQVDWTVLKTDGSPAWQCRGIEGEPLSPNALLSGYQPVLLPRPEVGGGTKLSPYNLIAAWYWVYGDPPRPVPIIDLQAAWLEQGAYPPAVLTAFDADLSGDLDEGELLLDSQAKVDLIAGRLAARGLASPRIAAEVEAHSLHHGVAPGSWATRDCRACHGKDSRLAQALQLSGSLPGGGLPEFGGGGALPAGDFYQNQDGALFFRSRPAQAGLYVLGHDRAGWVDLFGALAFTGTLLAAGAHGSLRFWLSLRRPRHTPRLKRVYMYAVYERFWHWLQTFVILGLIFTGLVIHRPDTFGIFSFHYVVLVHNVLAGLLVLNAALSLFYHLVSGEIRQFIPRPAGFFEQAIQQGLYYLRGIFAGKEHPFEKTPGKKLNPLQQATYFAILNLLLPLQILSGALMWGAQRWPELTTRLGGLPFLGPAHTLIAWLFASFVVMHVYLTTTGHAPLGSIQAMMVGWDELEVSDSQVVGEEPVQ